MMRDVEIQTLRNRIAQLAAEGREQEREAAAWLLAELQMRGPVGFNPAGHWLSGASRGCAIR